MGYVTVGPSCPVVRVGYPCPDRPFAGQLTVLTADGSQTVGQAQADATGYFTIALPPGHYILRPEPAGLLSRAAEVPVIVQAHQFTRQDIVYDSGMR